MEDREKLETVRKFLESSLEQVKDRLEEEDVDIFKNGSFEIVDIFKNDSIEIEVTMCGDISILDRNDGSEIYLDDEDIALLEEALDRRDELEDY
jgi:hypothetical protein